MGYNEQVCVARHTSINWVIGLILTALLACMSSQAYIIKQSLDSSGRVAAIESLVAEHHTAMHNSLNARLDKMDAKLDKIVDKIDLHIQGKIANVSMIR